MEWIILLVIGLFGLIVWLERKSPYNKPPIDHSNLVTPKKNLILAKHDHKNTIQKYYGINYTEGVETETTLLKEITADIELINQIKNCESAQEYFERCKVLVALTRKE